MTAKTTPWDNYWADNKSANSFEFDYSTNEGPYSVVSRFWQDTYKKFKEDSVIVDLGAGNGALANLYLQCQNIAKSKKWFNIDSADTTPIITSHIIEYLNEDIESLSFEAKSVEHFVSMFGVEYADFNKSLPAIFRILTQDGSCHFVIHHHQSVITKQSQITIQVYNALSEAGLFDKANEYKTPERLKHHLLSTLNKVLHASNANEQDDVKLVGQQVFHILQQSQSMQQCVANLLDLENQLSLHKVRLQQQIDAAMQANNLRACLKKYGFEDFSLSEMKFENMLMAWQLSYER